MVYLLWHFTQGILRADILKEDLRRLTLKILPRRCEHGCYEIPEGVESFRVHHVDATNFYYARRLEQFFTSISEAGSSQPHPRALTPLKVFRPAATSMKIRRAELRKPCL